MNADELINQVRSHPLWFVPITVLVVLTVVWLIGRIVKIAKSETPDEPLSNLGMLGGMGWSSEAVWTLTGPGGANLALPLRIALFAILEMILGVFMIRAKRNMRTIHRPGWAGRFAWLVAGGMSLVAVWTAHNAGEAFLRLLVPLLLTTMWWNGLVGEIRREADPDEGGRFNWTPRNLLIRVGAITPGAKDVKTVHRERLTQKMTTLYYDSLYGLETKREARRSRLARLTLDADDALVTEVMTRVRRTAWTTATPLPYEVTRADDAPRDASTEDGDAPVRKRVEVPSLRRTKRASTLATSGDAADADPATRAAHLVVTRGLSNRKAAAEIGGTSEASVRRRVNELRQTKGETHASDATHASSAEIVMTPIPDPRPSVTQGVNGHHPTTEETSP
jgi:hypothetical protein